MTTESEIRAFTRTGKAWSILLLAFISWIVISLWSFKVSGYSLASLVTEPDEHSVANDIANSAEPTTRIVAEAKNGDSSDTGDSLIELANEAEDLEEADREQVQIEAEEAAALAEQQAAEELRLKQEAEAEAEAQRLAAEAEADRERARIEAEEAAALAEQQAAEELRLKQEAEAEAQRLAAEAEADQERARIEAEEAAALAEQQAAEELRLKQEAEAEAQRLAAEAEAEADRERARIEAEEAAALAEQQAAEELRLKQEAEAEAQRLAAEAEADQERARIEAEEAAALAEQQAAEELRLKQEAEAEAQRLAAEAEADQERARIEEEEAALLAKQQVAEKLRLEQEAEAEAEASRLLVLAEEARIQSEEQARRERERRALELQAEAEEAEQARLVAQEQSEATSVLLEASAELSAREAQPASSDTGKNDPDTSPAETSEIPDLYEGEVVVLEPQSLPLTSIEVAAVEVETTPQSAPSRARQGAAAQRRASFLRLREQELKVLSGQSARIRFDPESSVISRDLERPLDRIFEPLFLYAETQVVITVSGNEYAGEVLDGELSLSRGAAIVEYLVSRGLDQERFTVQIESGEDLQLDTHRVRISAEEPVQ